jgi:DNA invertase Pin-like site-specific DNA recombinase
MGAFAEFERSLIRERITEGIFLAKQKGVYKGRKPSLDATRVAELIARDVANGHKNRSALARDFGISRETMYQYLRAGVTA